MKLKVKILPISTGNVVVAVLCEKDASRFDLQPADRVLLTHGKKKIVATVDIAGRINHVHGKYGQHMLHCGQIGLFAEAEEILGVCTDDFVGMRNAKKPDSLSYIKQKLKGETLTPQQIHDIVQDITKGTISPVEMAYFVAGSYIHDLDMQETAALTEAMVASGKVLTFKKKPIADKHCIGGVAANRTSPLVVPILAEVGLTIPKTSSRSITSAAGTADTMEVLCPVTLSLQKMKAVVKKTNACLVWGGALSLAPADDKIIQVEHSMSLDPDGQLLASILAKKKSVSATHVLIDIPVGRGAKIAHMKEAKKLQWKFEKLGKILGIHVKGIITDGSQPIGNGIGPSLEARDILWTLKNSSRGSSLLRDKSLFMAAELLELAGKARKGNGFSIAKQILDSGKAYARFLQIVKAQGGKEINPEHIRLAKQRHTVPAFSSGVITHIDNGLFNKMARIAGAPHDQEAGVYLYHHKGAKVHKGEKLFTVYSDSRERLIYAVDVWKQMHGIEIN